MTKKRKSGLLICIVAVLAISACGGGGGGGGGTAATQPTTATVKISTNGLAPGTLIAGIDFTLTLPAGVTVKATADSMNSLVFVTDNGVFTASGVAAGSNLDISIYTAATTTMPGKVIIKVINANGFEVGEFATVTCDIAAGNYPKEADFIQPVFTAVDVNGSPIAGLTIAFTAAIK
jgi:hypothetical protein